MRTRVLATRAVVVPSVKLFLATAAISASVRWDGPVETVTGTWTNAERVRSLTYLLASLVARLPVENELKSEATSPPKVVWEERVALAQLRSKVPIDKQWDVPHLPKKCLVLFDDHHPHLIQPSLDRPHRPPQMVSVSS